MAGWGRGDGSTPYRRCPVVRRALPCPIVAALVSPSWLGVSHRATGRQIDGCYAVAYNGTRSFVDMSLWLCVVRLET